MLNESAKVRIFFCLTALKIVAFCHFPKGKEKEILLLSRIR